MSKRFRLFSFAPVLATAALLSACSHDTPSEANHQAVGDSAGAAAVLGVNTYLWHASLDTVAFLPIASADPFGGVIISDWYAAPEAPTERFKVNIIILDRELRSDGVRVTVFRQNKTASGSWIDAPVDPKTGVDFENAILTRARQLRVAAVPAR